MAGASFLRAGDEQGDKRALSRRTNQMHTPPPAGRLREDKPLHQRSQGNVEWRQAQDQCINLFVGRLGT